MFEKTIGHSSTDVEEAVRYRSLEFKGQVRAGDRDLEVVLLQLISKYLIQNKISKTPWSQYKHREKKGRKD